MISPNGQALSFSGEDALRYRQSVHWLQPPTRTASMVGRQSVTVAALPGRRRERGDEPTVSLAHQRHLQQRLHVTGKEDAPLDEHSPLPQRH